jgi:amino acid transporter
LFGRCGGNDTPGHIHDKRGPGLATIDTDRDDLHALGYAQELKRGLGGFSNFAISFSIISILAGGMTSYWLGMVTGGPRVITLGWIIVGFFALLVGMSMGEICSAYPTAGGLYFWSAKLAGPKRNGARWSWFTGWFNLLGQIGVIASVDYALSIFIGFFIRLYSAGFTLTAPKVYVIYLIVLVVHGLLNTFGVKLVKLLGDVSVWWHVVGVLIIFGVLLAHIAPSGNRVGLLDKAPDLKQIGWPSQGLFTILYMFGVGMLLAQYTITGFDASAHVSEETVGARTEAPKAIVRAIYVSAVAAFILNLAMTLAIPKDRFYDIAFGAASDTNKYPTDDAFLVNAAPRLLHIAAGMGWAKLLIFISIVAQFFCGMASVTANSRMIYAFSRDGALPGSKHWHKINKKTRTPTNSIWLGVVLSAIVGALSLYQKGGYSTAFFAMTGICVIGLYIAYGIPIYLRITNPDFQVGPWNLKGRHKIVGWASLIWIGLITLLFFAPIFRPFWKFWDSSNEYTPGFFKQNNVNFTGPLIIGSGLVFWLYWQLSGRKWFTGPKVQGTKEELMAIERELGELG